MRSNTLASTLVLFALLSGACGSATPAAQGETPSPVETAVPTPVTGPALPLFAPYYEPIVSVAPAVAHEPIAADLSNVRVLFLLSDGLRQRLAQNSFVVAPGSEKEFFTVYEKARYDNQPVFVTSDSLLHVYHLLFDKVLDRKSVV